MSSFARTRQGFTILEILIVVTLLGIIAAMLLSGFRNYTAYQQYTQAIRNVQALVQESQTNARLSVGGTAHGIKIQTNSITQFVGDTYTLTDPANRVTELTTIELTPSLSGGVDEIVFGSLSGYPSAVGDIDIAGTSYSAATSIEVTAGGVVQ